MANTSAAAFGPNCKPQLQSSFWRSEPTRAVWRGLGLAAASLAPSRESLRPSFPAQQPRPWPRRTQTCCDIQQLAAPGASPEPERGRLLNKWKVASPGAMAAPSALAAPSGRVTAAPTENAARAEATAMGVPGPAAGSCGAAEEKEVVARPRLTPVRGDPQPRHDPQLAAQRSSLPPPPLPAQLSGISSRDPLSTDGSSCCRRGKVASPGATAVLAAGTVAAAAAVAAAATAAASSGKGGGKDGQGNGDGGGGGRDGDEEPGDGQGGFLVNFGTAVRVLRDDIPQVRCGAVCGARCRPSLSLGADLTHLPRDALAHTCADAGPAAAVGHLPFRRGAGQPLAAAAARPQPLPPAAQVGGWAAVMRR